MRRCRRTAVVDRDEQLRAAEHFAVAPEHTAGAVVILQHLKLIAGGKQRPIARDGSLVPAVRLRRAGDEGAQLCVLRAVSPCGEDGLGKILIAAAGHAAQEGMKAPVIDLPHRAAQKRLERGTARIIFVLPPWQAPGRWPVKAQITGTSSRFVFSVYQKNCLFTSGPRRATIRVQLNRSSGQGEIPDRR